jgi:hypothetical protein
VENATFADRRNRLTWGFQLFHSLLHWLAQRRPDANRDWADNAAVVPLCWLGIRFPTVGAAKANVWCGLLRGVSEQEAVS